MKKLIIALSFGVLTCPLYAAEAENADSLRAKLEALQQQLVEKETQKNSLQSEYEDKQTTSTDLQKQVDKQAKLIELLKNALSQGSQTVTTPTPVATTETDDDDDEILEIELTE